MSLKSRRLATTFLRIPNSTSVLRDRSCASSMTMTLHNGDNELKELYIILTLLGMFANSTHSLKALLKS